MEDKALIEKVKTIKNLAEEIMAAPDMEPFVMAGMDSVHAHILLVYNELGLDIEE